MSGMSDIVIHVLLFLVASLAVVTMGTFYSHADDATALKELPRRYGVFVASCAVVAAVMLIAEMVFLP